MPPIGENIQITLVLLVGLFALQLAYPGVEAFVESEMLVSGWRVVAEGKVWTILTYVLWHDGYGHLLANGITLVFFGGYVEARWSRAEFWIFSLICAVGSGLTILVWQLAQTVFFLGLIGLDGSSNFWLVLDGLSRPTLGYSGVVTGLLAAFAYFMWDRDFRLIVIPMTGKWLFFLVIGLDVIRVCGGANVSLAGHLGGLGIGLLATHRWFSGKESPFGGDEPEAGAFERELFEDATSARDRGDWEEVYRLCHQIRSGRSRLPGAMRDDIWEMLAVAATRLDRYEEAETYLERAPETTAVQDARQEHERNEVNEADDTD